MTEGGQATKVRLILILTSTYILTNSNIIQLQIAANGFTVKSSVRTLLSANNTDHYNMIILAWQMMECDVKKMCNNVHIRNKSENPLFKIWSSENTCSFRKTENLEVMCGG